MVILEVWDDNLENYQSSQLLSRSKQDGNAGKMLGKTETNEDIIANNNISKVCLELHNAQRTIKIKKKGGEEGPQVA